MDIVNQKKKLTGILKKARDNAKPNKCIICDEPQTSFCNSHLIPQMILRTIADNGKLLQPNVLIGIEMLDIEKGVNNASTFHFICKQCDSILFQNYENKDILKRYPTDKMMAEIALKNLILMLSKRNEEKALFNLLQKEHNALIHKDVLDEIHGLDTRDFSDELELYKKIIANKSTGCFHVLYWKKLPHVVPIAAQSPIAVYKDMDGNIINDLYNMDSNYRIQNLHLCVFPIENETIVLLFCHKRDKYYRSLRHQFNSTSDNICLMYINYLILACTENYFFSKTIKDKIESNENLMKLSRESNELPNLGFIKYSDYISEYTPVSMDEIPNFLSGEFKLQREV